MRQAEQRRQTRERDADVARETILRAALDIFASRGFSGARVDDIAEAAGYNKALIFHYFSDKLGLYQTLVTRMKHDITTRLGGNLAHYERDGELAPDATGCADFFISCAHMVFDYYVEHPEIRRMMQWEVAEGWHTFSACPVKIADPQWPQRVTNVIRDAQAAGIVRSDLDPDLPFMMCVSVPLIYLASIHRFELIFTERDYSSPEALKRARDQIASLLLQGVLTPEAAARYKTTTSATSIATSIATSTATSTARISATTSTATQGEGEGDTDATGV